MQKYEENLKYCSRTKVNKIIWNTSFASNVDLDHEKL